MSSSRVMSNARRGLSTRTIKTVYRELLRDAKALVSMPNFRLRRPLKKEMWGHGHYVDNASLVDSQVDSLGHFLKWQREPGLHVAWTPDQQRDKVLQMIRDEFKAHRELKDPVLIGEKLDQAFGAVRAIAEQRTLTKCSSVTKTRSVEIDATSLFLTYLSSTEMHRFMYRITITNTHPTDSMLITGRQFLFEGDGGFIQVVPRHSPGIVGHTPELRPGESFVYASGADIDGPVGQMQGCLHVLQRDPEHSKEHAFDAVISRLLFRTPQTLEY